ncbi:MAG: thymidylate synthase [Blastocatellia bacterium]
MKAFDSIDEIQHAFLDSLLRDGESVQPRGMPTLELSAITFKLLNPRKRTITNPMRRWSLPLALGEFCWHVSGSNEVSFIEYYAKRWRDFAEDGSTIRGSCYGHKIFKQPIEGPSQWKRIIKLLQTDRYSRRAILNFSDFDLPVDITPKDVSCACTLQFLIRSDKLHAFAYMRSNDAIWGLPYDVFLFTMLQELMALELGVEPGSYNHFATSLHLYEQHIQLARRIVSSGVDQSFEMKPMIDHRWLSRFLTLESRIRMGERLDYKKEVALLPAFWRDLVEVLSWFRSTKELGGPSEAASMIPIDSPYEHILRNLTASSLI